MGQASLGRRAQSCRRGASQGEGDLLAHGIDDFSYQNTHGCLVCMYILNQVRDETDTEQFGRLDKEQQEEMKKFERPVVSV